MTAGSEQADPGRPRPTMVSYLPSSEVIRGPSTSANEQAVELSRLQHAGDMLVTGGAEGCRRYPSPDAATRRDGGRWARSSGNRHQVHLPLRLHDHLSERWGGSKIDAAPAAWAIRLPPSFRWAGRERSADRSPCRHRGRDDRRNPIHCKAARHQQAGKQYGARHFRTYPFFLHAFLDIPPLWIIGLEDRPDAGADGRIGDPVRRQVHLLAAFLQVGLVFRRVVIALHGRVVIV